MRLARTGVVSAAVAALLGSSLVMASPASAGEDCSWAGCSATQNSTDLPVLVKKNWTCDWGSTGSSSFACAGGDAKWLSGGERTADDEDWDVFTVDAGWCYEVRFINEFIFWDKTYDMRDVGEDLNVKVSDIATAYIYHQSTKSCDD